jgi:phosphopantetheinyl transferase
LFPVDLDQPASVVARLERMLPASECDAPVPVRVARAATRLVLAEALHVDPLDVEISRQCVHCGHPSHGRPTVSAAASTAGPVSFSLSHSGAFAIVALAAGEVRLGVDVEEIKGRPRIDGLAARVLNDEEHARWLAIDDSNEQLRSFLRSWTAKEAYLKALGIGIVTRLRDVPDRVDGWCTRRLELGESRIGALAVDRNDVEVRYSVLSLLARSNGGTAR